MFLGTTVHTTGVNWDGLVANAVSITLIVGMLGGLLLKLINRSIEDKITAAVKVAVEPIQEAITDLKTVLDQHGRDISYLKGMQEGKRMALDEMAQGQKS